MDIIEQHGVFRNETPFDSEAVSAPPEASDGTAPPATVAPRPVERKNLINKLNYLNFQGRTVLLAFEHTKYGHTLRVEAQPQPCRDNRVRCTWVDPGAARSILRSHTFQSLLIPDQECMLQGGGEVISLDEEGIVIELSEFYARVGARRVVRYPCTGIQVQLLSNGSRFDGTLVDFSPLSFRVRVSALPPQSFIWLTAGEPLTVVLANERELLFSGTCRIVSETGGRRTREYVLEPTQDRIHRYDPKQHRSVRQEIVPTPTIVFQHPLTGRLVSLKVLDLSQAGLAVEESMCNAVLMPGLVIPRLDLCLTNNLKLPCRAQVVYREAIQGDSDDPRVKSGLALLDMEVADHVELVGLLHHADDRRSYVCNQVDMDELWSFFFETGFIYPQKYQFIQKNREQIKQTYEKLYTRSPSIARHFIYQDKGRILGHMAMLRFYENTWLIHHHAARGNHSFRAGFNVLEQISRFVSESCRLTSMHMEYVICFYRPDNRFPRTVFGGVCGGIDDPRKCSESLFGYFHFQLDPNADNTTLTEYSLAPAVDNDLRELASLCQHQSDGLMLSALDLEPDDIAHGDLSEDFHKVGLKRERQLYALKRNDQVLAVVMINLADIGLNLSDLTNSITVFVLDQHQLTNQTIYATLSVLMTRLGQQEIPVLIYPEAIAKALNLPVEKHYMMWSLMPRHSDSYNRSLNAILRTGRRNGGSHDKRRSSPV